MLDGATGDKARCTRGLLSRISAAPERARRRLNEKPNKAAKLKVVSVWDTVIPRSPRRSASMHQNILANRGGDELNLERFL